MVRIIFCAGHSYKNTGALTNMRSRCEPSRFPSFNLKWMWHSCYVSNGSMNRDLFSVQGHDANWIMTILNICDKTYLLML